MPLLLSALASRLASTPSPAAARGSTRRSSRLPCPRAPAVPVTRSRGYSSTLPWMSSLLWMPPPQWMPLPIEAARARGPSRSYCRSPFARVAARAFGSILRARAVLDATAALDAALFRGDARPRSGRSFSLLFSRSSRGLRHRLGAPGLFCISAADASLDVSFMCITLVASAEASAAHSVQDVRGMAIVGRRHVKSSSSGRAVATEESEGALRGHVSFPRE
eukprot:5681954-Prymnesium_polylepis.1